MRATLAAFALAITTTFAVSAAPQDITLPAGTVLRVRLDRSVGSDLSRVEDSVSGHLVSPLVVGGKTVAPAGAAVGGHVTQAVRSGKVKGRARLGMRFETLTIARSRYDIATRPWSAVAPGTKKKDAATIGLPAAGGAIVGALVGGKKGAAIGAAAGGGGGTAVVLSTRGKEVRLGRGAIVNVRLSEPLTIRTTRLR
jgi:hypothetical protein